MNRDHERARREWREREHQGAGGYEEDYSGRVPTRHEDRWDEESDREREVRAYDRRESEGMSGAGNAGNWGSRPVRSGSFGELGGQGFLGGGPSSGQVGGGYGRGEGGRVGGRGPEDARGSEGRPSGVSYAGRGPKNYRRPDERIEEEINERLERDPEIDATDIEVTVKDGEVTLSGTVESRRVKRLAEDLVDDVYGVKDVQNRLRASASQGGGPSARQGS